jgi:hypothetical protein
MFDVIRRLFGNDSFTPLRDEIETSLLVPNPEFKDDGWKLISDGNIPHDVILAAVDSYDCGWVMDTVCRIDGDETWYLSGSLENVEAHMEYTHWRELPNPPKTHEDY